MITLSHAITGGDFDSAGAATRKLKEQLVRLGVGSAALRRVMIASYEAEMNVVIHARTGTLWARLDAGRLDLEIADEGPGIPDVELAMREGWSTASEKAKSMGFGAGMGLPNIRRNSDLFEIDTRPGKGTRVRSTILLTGDVSDVSRENGARQRAMLAVSPERCRGCRRCIFSCPAGALRVQETHPVIRHELCIGCAACIEACPDGVFGMPGPQGAQPAAIPEDCLLIAPRGFLSGFPGSQPQVRILRALRDMGFAEVRLLDDWEEALRAEVRREVLQQDLPLPRIPPFCPPLVALIESRFPSLIPNLASYLSPAETACEEFPLRPVVLVAACPAQYAACAGASVTQRLTVLDPGALAQSILPLLGPRTGAEEGFPPLYAAETVHGADELSVSGVREVLRVLSLVEAGALQGMSLLDLHLCAGTCAASALLTPDPQLALRQAGAASPAGAQARPGHPSAASAAPRSRPYARRPGVRLDPDMAEAMKKLALIDRQARSLPGRDCGSCGAPSCAAFAEDVVLGRADLSGCPYREKSR